MKPPSAAVLAFALALRSEAVTTAAACLAAIPAHLQTCFSSFSFPHEVRGVLVARVCVVPTRLLVTLVVHDVLVVAVLVGSLAVVVVVVVVVDVAVLVQREDVIGC